MSCHRTLRRRAGSTALLILATVITAGAAPHHGERFLLAQPDGEQIEVRVWGDEFFQHIESVDGYTLIRDPRTRVICYADRGARGRRLVSTGVAVGGPVPPELPPGLALSREARAAEALRVRERFLAHEARLLAGQDRNVEPANQGDVLGLTVIVDFSDEVATVPASSFVDFLNQPGYAGSGNNGSVRDYFHDVSGGMLTYTNWVSPVYLRAPQPKSYYEDPDQEYGARARELVRWALAELDGQGHDFSVYDSNGDSFIDAINLYYAGYPSGGWSVGLWPHAGRLAFAVDGVFTYQYQIADIGNVLTLDTFCHENGHLLMFWPDLYDYGFESAGIGGFCLMSSSGPVTNPVRPCAYLRAEAGWTAPTLLEGMQADVAVSHDAMDILRVSREEHPGEYYLLENRQRTGRDAGLPDAGLAIWHVDEGGDNDHEQQDPGAHYLVTLVQADGRWDLENNVNHGDDTDLWKAPDLTAFDPTTIPAATWWDGGDAPVYVDAISGIAETMTFDYRGGPGMLAVTVDPRPAALAAPWSLAGPGGFLVEREGLRSLMLPAAGDYTLSWGDVPGWTRPSPAVRTFTMMAGDPPLVIVGDYTGPPFAVVAGGAAGHAGTAMAGAVVDVDADGDADLHVINEGEPDVLLRNDGDLVFTEATPEILADAGAGRGAAWGDYDHDGDRDCYLVRDGQDNIMFEQVAGGFIDATGFSYGLDDTLRGLDASWCDVAGNGRLDLYLVRWGSRNKLFVHNGPLADGHPLYWWWHIFGEIEHAGAGRTAAWCDYDGDGDRDVYLVNDGQDNVLLSNLSHGIGFISVAEQHLVYPGPSRDAVWGDFDNDGDWDIYVVNAGEADVFCRQEAGAFSRDFSAHLCDEGAGRSVSAADLDNDGFLDLYVTRDGQEDLALFGDGAGGFVRAHLLLPEVEGPAVATLCADLDGDGGVDLYQLRDGQPNVLLRNQITDRGHWLAVDLQGDPDNRDGIGARVRVVAGGVSQLREVPGGDGLGQTGRQVHLGLGAASVVDSVVVTWPTGLQTVRVGVPADGVLLVAQAGDPIAVDDIAPAAPTGFRGAWPNPFNPVVTVAFALAEPGPVRLSVYGVDGRRVADLVEDHLPAGAHEVRWRGRDREDRPVASGTYLCRLETRQGAQSLRLALVR